MQDGTKCVRYVKEKHLNTLTPQDTTQLPTYIFTCTIAYVIMVIFHSQILIKTDIVSILFNIQVNKCYLH